MAEQLLLLRNLEIGVKTRCVSALISTLCNGVYRINVLTTSVVDLCGNWVMHPQSIPLQNRIFRSAAMESSRVFLARSTLRVIKGVRSKRCPDPWSGQRGCLWVPFWAQQIDRFHLLFLGEIIFLFNNSCQFFNTGIGLQIKYIKGLFA